MGAESRPQAGRLTVARTQTHRNELELVQADASNIEQTRRTLGELFKRCEGLVSSAAFAYFTNVCGLTERQPI